MTFPLLSASDVTSCLITSQSIKFDWLRISIYLSNVNEKGFVLFCAVSVSSCICSYFVYLNYVYMYI